MASLPTEPNDNALSTHDDSDTYVQAATAENTRRAYRAGIKHFLAQGGGLPATPAMVVDYLKALATSHNPRTLEQRMVHLRQWHKLSGHPDPTQDPTVKKTIRGIARLHGQAKHQALALRLDVLDQLMLHLKEQDSLIAVRNRALILVGFFGALRRSELVSLKWEQVEFVKEGMIITLPRSKTDQVGEGAPCVIPFGNELRCPVRALLAWQKASRVWEGAIFRRLSKTGTVRKTPISSQYVSCILKQLVKEAGLPNSDAYSAHSLRRGFATESSRLGAPLAAIKQHGRWKSTKIVIEYIEAGRQFEDSAVSVLFDFL